ncbi:MAG: Na/Pi cotransporter family protein [Spirochaetes bacterium]|nr:Na/Pi cotransporter family protein [Spirochaetota bacterium]
MARELLFGFIGGMGLFLFGMKMMSESLKKVAGERLRKTLDILTKKPIIGLLIGTLVTCLVQSSSATTVMTVGFVNAGLLTLRQAISIILGANIGTTLTAWLISFFALFKITNYALPAIGLGFLITLIGKSNKTKMWGRFILGFGLLFTGLGFIKDTFLPLKDSEALKHILVTFSNYPILGILLGIGMTVIFQSSSATIALLQIMAFSGLIDFQTTIPIILGDNIGTTVTAELSAIGTNISARRAAHAHALLNVLGVCYMIIPVVTGIYGRFIQMLIPGPVTRNNVMLHIALSHSVFNIVNSLFVFLPLISVLEKLTVKLARVRPGSIDMAPIYLEKHLLDTPPLAIKQAIKEILRMMEIACETVQSAYHCFLKRDLSLGPRVTECEDAVDLLQKEITQYLVELSRKNLDIEEAEKIPVLLHSVNDVERVSDHAVNILELAQRRTEQKLALTGTALSEAERIYSVADSMFRKTMEALKEEEEAPARAALEDEKLLNNMHDLLKENHIRRVNIGECDMLAGIVFMDFVDNIEKIGDHLTNIAQAVLRHLRWNLEINLKDAATGSSSSKSP